MKRLEQRHCIKFCHKLDDSQVETIRKIQMAFDDDAIGSPIMIILSQINPVPHTDTYFFKVHSNIVLPPTPRPF